MKAYTIYRYDKMGFEYDAVYAIKYNKALREFNNLLRKAMNDVYDTIEKKDFSEEVNHFKEWDMGKTFDNSETDIELICRKCPFIMFKQKGKLIARVYSWGQPSYEYSEQDIESEDIVLKEIELLE